MIMPHEAQSMHSAGQGAHAAQMAALARKAVFEAGAHGASRQTWIEVARPMVCISFTNTDAITGLGSAGVAYGATVVLATFNLAIGSDLKNILASSNDCKNWNSSTFKFGNLELFPNGEGPLGVFDPKAEHVDHIAPWIHAKTINDVPVTCTVVNRTLAVDSNGIQFQTALAVFKGFVINVYAEEQVCQITNRLMQTDRSMGTLDSMVQLRGMYSHALGMPLSPVMLQPSAQTGARFTPMPGGAVPPSPQYR